MPTSLGVRGSREVVTPKCSMGELPCVSQTCSSPRCHNKSPLIVAECNKDYSHSCGGQKREIRCQQCCFLLGALETIPFMPLS